MSNFYCEKCGKAILEGPGGHYITGCKHYPKEKLWPFDKYGEYHLGDLMYNLEKLKEKEKTKMGTTKDAPEKHIAHNFFIAGVQFHELHKVIKSLEIGNNFELVPEPTNKFDPNAVRLEYNTSNETIMCGYVPKKFSAEITAIISIGKRLECKIIELNPEKKPWEQCKISIEEVK